MKPRCNSLAAQKERRIYLPRVLITVRSAHCSFGRNMIPDMHFRQVVSGTRAGINKYIPFSDMFFSFGKYRCYLCRITQMNTPIRICGNTRRFCNDTFDLGILSRVIRNIGSRKIIDRRESKHPQYEKKPDEDNPCLWALPIYQEYRRAASNQQYG